MSVLGACSLNTRTHHPPGEEVAELEALEGQYRAAQDKFKHKKREVHQMESDMQVSQWDGQSVGTLHEDTV